MNSTVLLYAALPALLAGCTAKSPDPVFVPRQAGEYVWIYKPAGDHFYGPDTEHLKMGTWYEEWVPNDHTTVRDTRGRWHIIGITHPLVESEPLNLGIHEGEYASFHAISAAVAFDRTLQEHHYTDLPKILPPSQRPGEPLENQAPYIVDKDGLYHMFYGPSPIRLAVSSNLSDWETRGVLFHEPEGARDPNILWHDSTYYMVYCTLRSVRLRESRDLVHWSQPVAIFTSGSFDPESPSLVHFNDVFYLFVCAWDGNWDGMDIQGAYQHRTYVLHSRDPVDFGADREKLIATLDAHAPEIFRDEAENWYISSAEWPNRGVSVARLEWERQH
jgi:hypothetical protein